MLRKHLSERFTHYTKYSHTGVIKQCTNHQTNRLVKDDSLLNQNPTTKCILMSVLMKIGRLFFFLAVNHTITW